MKSLSGVKSDITGRVRGKVDGRDINWREVAEAVKRKRKDGKGN